CGRHSERRKSRGRSRHLRAEIAAGLETPVTLAFVELKRCGIPRSVQLPTWLAISEEMMGAIYDDERFKQLMNRNYYPLENMKESVAILKASDQIDIR